MSNQTRLTPEVRQWMIETLDQMQERVGEMREAIEKPSKARKGGKVAEEKKKPPTGF